MGRRSQKQKESAEAVPVEVPLPPLPFVPPPLVQPPTPLRYAAALGACRSLCPLTTPVLVFAAHAQNLHLLRELWSSELELEARRKLRREEFMINARKKAARKMADQPYKEALAIRRAEAERQLAKATEKAERRIASRTAQVEKDLEEKRNLLLSKHLELAKETDRLRNENARLEKQLAGMASQAKEPSGEAEWDSERRSMKAEIGRLSSELRLSQSTTDTLRQRLKDLHDAELARVEELQNQLSAINH